MIFLFLVGGGGIQILDVSVGNTKRYQLSYKALGCSTMMFMIFIRHYKVLDLLMNSKLM